MSADNAPQKIAPLAALTEIQKLLLNSVLPVPYAQAGGLLDIIAAGLAETDDLRTALAAATSEASPE